MHNKIHQFATHSVFSLTEKVSGGILVNFIDMRWQSRISPGDYLVRDDGRVVIPGNNADAARIVGEVSDHGIFLTNAEAQRLGF